MASAEDASAAVEYVFSMTNALTVGGNYLFALAIVLCAHRMGKTLMRDGEEQRQEFYDSLEEPDSESTQEQEMQQVSSMKSRHQRQVETNSYREMFLFDTAGYILKYDCKNAVSLNAILVWKHTVITVPAIMSRIMLGMGIAAVVFLLDAALFVFNVEKIKFSVDDINSATEFFNTFIGVLLAFYVNTMLARWWDVRNSTMGRLWGAVDDLCLLMSAHLQGEAWRPFRSLVLRYSLASYELTFMQAQGEDAHVDHLVSRGLLTRDEAEALRDLPSKPQVMWTWVAGMFGNAHKQGHICNIILEYFYTKCLDARGGIGATFAYLDTQLPFMYVHLLAVLVHAANMIVSINAGISAAHHIMHSTDRSENPKPCMRLLQVVLQTFFYNACLEIGRIFSDPLGTDFEDFPRHAWNCFMRNECEAFDRAGQMPTKAMRAAADAVAAVPLPSPQSPGVMSMATTALTSPSPVRLRVPNGQAA